MRDISYIVAFFGALFLLAAASKVEIYRVLERPDKKTTRTRSNR